MCVTMSSSRWETSQRPLFVKSVWQNGYRHAILSKEDPVIKCKKRHSSSRLRSAKQSNSARSKTKSTGSSESLIIPAVQLLLANVRCLEEENIKSEKNKLVKTYNNVITREHVSMNIKNVDVEVNLIPNTKQLPTRYFYNQQNNEPTKQIKNNLDYMGTSLTERVLLWLDLAGRYPNEMYKNDDEPQENKLKTRNVRKESKRISTAHPNITPQLSIVNQNNENIFVRKCTKNSHFVSVNKEEPMTDDLYNPEEDYSILKGHRKVRSSSPVPVAEPLVTSQLEITSEYSSSKKSTNHNEICKYTSQTLCKRQVHIFMPLVLKKNAENTSVISASTDVSVKHS